MITPGRLPLVRDDLLQVWTRGLGQMLTVTSERVLTPYVHGRPEPIQQYVNRLTRWLGAADLYWVTEDMTAVAVQAGTSLPTYRLHVADIPSEVGLLVWQRPVVALPGSSTGAGWVAVTAALWGPVTADPKGTPGVHVVTLADTYQYAATADVPDQMRAELRAAHLMYHDEAPLPFLDATDTTMRNEALRTLLSTWLLCGQQLTADSPYPVDRQIRRGYARAGRPEPAVRQIALRRAARPSDPEAPPGEGVAWRHRWVVRGHWRHHWYPTQERHRPLWISDYVKGPDWLPLVGGERVNVLRR